jgi:hypothetical protein
MKRSITLNNKKKKQQQQQQQQTTITKFMNDFYFKTIKLFLIKFILPLYVYEYVNYNMR